MQVLGMLWVLVVVFFGFGHDEIVTITKWSRIQVASGEENDLIFAQVVS